jgi:hypothetical protein
MSANATRTSAAVGESPGVIDESPGATDESPGATDESPGAEAGEGAGGTGTLRLTLAR